MGKRAKIFWETSVGSLRSGSVLLLSLGRWRGPRIGFEEEKRVGDEGRVPPGVPGRETLFTALVKKDPVRVEDGTYNAYDVVIRVAAVSVVVRRTFSL